MSQLKQDADASSSSCDAVDAQSSSVASSTPLHLSALSVSDGPITQTDSLMGEPDVRALQLVAYSTSPPFSSASVFSGSASSPPSSFSPISMLYRDATHSVLRFLTLTDLCITSQLDHRWYAALLSLPPQRFGEGVRLPHLRLTPSRALLLLRSPIVKHVAELTAVYPSAKQDEEWIISSMHLLPALSSSTDLLSLRALTIELLASDISYEGLSFPALLTSLSLTVHLAAGWNVDTAPSVVRTLLRCLAASTPALTCFDLSYGSIKSHMPLHALLPASTLQPLTGLPRLASLSLHDGRSPHQWWTEDHIMLFRSIEHLTELNIHGLTWAQLLQLTAPPCQLRLKRLPSNATFSVWEEEVEFVARVFQQMTQLEEVRLSVNVSSLMCLTSLSRLRRVRLLWLEGVHRSMPGEVLLDGLQHCPMLEELTLSGFSEVETNHMHTLLEQHRQLVELTVIGLTGVTSLSFLSAAPSTLQRLIVQQSDLPVSDTSYLEQLPLPLSYVSLRFAGSAQPLPAVMQRLTSKFAYFSC